jgi:hypothetical protein
MRCLELFSGTCSFSKCCEKLGFETLSLDKYDDRADIVEDILDWDYKKYPSGYFNLIWSSPPCEKYSNLQHIHSNKEEIEKGMIEADKLVAKTLEIIYYFKPDFWFLENPYKGQLKKRDVIKKHKYYIVDYCKYADWGYRKRTCIWTNKRKFKPRRCYKDCNSMDDDGVGHRTDVSYLSNIDDRHRIPPELIYCLIYNG